MARNIGYLHAKKSAKADECYTPAYAVLPAVEFLRQKGYKKVWCPFDDETSQYVRVLKKYKFKVINTHLADNHDFLTMKSPKSSQYDVIVSNPPYSIKDKVIAHCYSLNKPFMLLMPLPALQSRFRYKYFSQGLELLVFDGRISYFTNGNSDRLTSGNSFASAYFCRNVLPEKLMFKPLAQYINEINKNNINISCHTDARAILDKIDKNKKINAFKNR